MQDLVFFASLVIVWWAAVCDFRTHRIPNFLVVFGAFLAIVMQAYVTGFGGFFVCLSGLLVGLLIFLPGYFFGFTGAGDVKLMAVIGAFVGPANVLAAGLLSIVAGGIVALGIASSSLLFSRSYISPWWRYGLMARTMITTGQVLYIPPKDGEVMGKKFPFAISIALGTTGWLVWQWVR